MFAPPAKSPEPAVAPPAVQARAPEVPRHPPLRPGADAAAHVLRLQRTAGNQSVLRLLSGRADGAPPEVAPAPRGAGPVRIASPHDPSEGDATRAADRTIEALHPGSPPGAMTARSRAPARAGAEAGSAVPPSVTRVVAEPGRPLDAAALGPMSRAAGRDFG